MPVKNKLTTFLRRFAYSILLSLNVAVGIGYLFCAYSSYVCPVLHPYLACAGLSFPLWGVLNALFVVFWLFVNWKCALLPVFVFAMGWESMQAYLPLNVKKSLHGGDTIKVLTYNVEGFGDKSSDDGRSILSYLKGCGADIICLQEFTTHRTVSEKEIKQALASYPYGQVVHTRGGDGLACYSRFPILSASLVGYSSLFNGSAIFRLQMGTDTLVLVNNHLESNKLTSKDKGMYREILTAPREEVVKSGGKHLLRKLGRAVAIRAVQADSVADAIRRNRTRYMVVCGDINDSPVSYAHRVIGRGLTDAYREAGFGPGFSYNRNHLYFRIDHLFVSNDFRVVKCEVDRSIRASDHYPLWSLLEK